MSSTTPARVDPGTSSHLNPAHLLQNPVVLPLHAQLAPLHLLPDLLDSLRVRLRRHSSPLRRGRHLVRLRLLDSRHLERVNTRVLYSVNTLVLVLLLLLLLHSSVQLRVVERLSREHHEERDDGDADRDAHPHRHHVVLAQLDRGQISAQGFVRLLGCRPDGGDSDGRGRFLGG